MVTHRLRRFAALRQAPNPGACDVQIMPHFFKKAP